jgi:hypothetical protein
VDITKVSEVVQHNTKVVDMVATATVNLKVPEKDTKMQPEGGTPPIKTEGEETRYLKEHNQQQHHTEEAIT